MAIGQRLFINNCATCHGSDARGSKGFPNLTDGDWLHGGTPEKIEETITLGRTGIDAADGGGGRHAQDVHNVAQYVLSLSASPHDSIAAAAGKSKFAACAACHGVDGKGNPALGAPNLTDKVWLHGWGEEAIVDIVNNGKTNVMPAQSGRLTPEQIHVLASYVWSLSQRASSRRSETARALERRWTRAAGEPASSRSSPLRRGGDGVALHQRGQDPAALGARLVRGLALGPRLAHPAAVLRPAVAAMERPPAVLFDLARAASTSSAWSCIRRT